MKALYIDCGAGAAGDMITAGLLELLDDPDAFVEKLNNAGIPKVRFVREKSVKMGVCGTHMSVLVDGEEEQMADGTHESLGSHEHFHNEDAVHDGHVHLHEDAGPEEHGHSHDHHSHTGMDDIKSIVGSLKVPDNVKKDILSVYEIIAKAESHVHGEPVSQIHFHEVGNMDAIADITAVCLLMDELKPQKIFASPVQVGSGTVKCAHGILPVPAPATAFILKGIPVYSTDIKGEMCTPTGAALLKYFASEFGSMPVMIPEKTGYGMGKKDFPILNAVRITVGEICEDGKNDSRKNVKSGFIKKDDEDITSADSRKTGDSIIELACNIDDCTGEEIGFAAEKIFEAGAKDVFTVPIQMKKSRPAVMLCAICEKDKKDEVVKAIFKHTTTFGIRQYECRRYVLDRRIETVETSYGPVRKKIGEGYGTVKEKLEYDDLKRLADENNTTIEQIKRSVK